MRLTPEINESQKHNFSNSNVTRVLSAYLSAYLWSFGSIWWRPLTEAQAFQMMSLVIENVIAYVASGSFGAQGAALWPSSWLVIKGGCRRVWIVSELCFSGRVYLSPALSALSKSLKGYNSD